MPKKTEIIDVRVARETKERLIARARADGRSMSDVVRELIETDLGRAAAVPSDSASPESEGPNGSDVPPADRVTGGALSRWRGNLAVAAGLAVGAVLGLVSAAAANIEVILAPNLQDRRINDIIFEADADSDRRLTASEFRTLFTSDKTFKQDVSFGAAVTLAAPARTPEQWFDPLDIDRSKTLGYSEIEPLPQGTTHKLTRD